jgi:hypothetical protein
MKAAQKKGLRYEAVFGRMLERERPSDSVLHANRWLLFKDDYGTQYAQPDFVLEFPTAEGLPSAILFECKLTQSTEATFQLFQLYGPLLEELLQIPLLKIQVVYNRTPGAYEGPVVTGLDETLHLLAQGKVAQLGLWHWMPEFDGAWT